jgi:tetratricopeptide (TPR) repeat protein
VEATVKLICLAWMTAVLGLGTTAGDYYNRSFHAETIPQRIDLLTEALKIDPNHVPSLRHRAQAYLLLAGDETGAKKAEHEKLALADEVKAADLVPDDAEINFNAGMLAEKLKDYGVAARLYQNAVGTDPRNVLLCANLIQMRIKLLEIDKALNQADELVKQHPEEDVSLSIRAQVYEWKDRYSDAVKDLTTLIQRHPDEAKYYLGRCIDYRGMGDYPQALADAQKAIDLRGGEGAYAFAARGCCYEGLADDGKGQPEYEKALEDYARAATMDTEKRYYTIWSCIVLRKMGRRRESEQRAAEFLKEFRKDVKNEDWITPVVMFLAGDMTEDEVLRRAAKPDDPETKRQQLCEAYYYLGACRMADKQYVEAEPLLKKAIGQRVNNFYEHSFALRELRNLEKLKPKDAPAKKGDDKNGQGRPK